MLNLIQAIQLNTKSNHLVTDYKPNMFSQRHDQIGVLTGLPLLHTGSTGQAVHCAPKTLNQTLMVILVYIKQSTFSLALKQG